MKTIGLTGNLGSGKTTVAKVFESFGFVIIDVDALAKQLYTVPKIRQQVENLIGKSISDEYGRINYSLIAEHYFNEDGIYIALNSILYPALQKNIASEMAAVTEQNVIVEAAMLFEIGLKDYFDFIITVSTPIEERMNRIYKRNGSKHDQFMDREKLQSPAEWKEKYSDFVIFNDKRSSIITQVCKIVESIR